VITWQQTIAEGAFEIPNKLESSPLETCVEQVGVFSGSIDKEIMKGVFNSHSVVQVRAFGGSAFQMPQSAEPLMILGEGAKSYMPEQPFEVNADTPIVSMAGWYQGAVLAVGKGRVAVFADAAMFTSQVPDHKGKVYGLVSDGAEQNEQFLLNVMHWLSKTI
jgi:hypothetical protein